MKITLTISLYLLSALCGLSQDQKIPTLNPAPDGALDHNYIVHFQRVKDGTNNFDVRAVTATRGFHIKVAKPEFSFSGKLFIRSEDKAYLEYEFTSVSQPDELEKKAGKSQANNQMFASGLVSFVIKSALNYNPQQNEANQNGVRSQPPTSVRSAALLTLGQPIAIMVLEKETYKISVERL